MKEYWKQEEFLALELAQNVHDLREIAFGVLERIPKPIVQVCGPISTGGKGSIEENLKVFRETIDAAARKGYNVFDQTLFEGAMHRMKPQGRYFMEVMIFFYRPIFQSGKINQCLFIHDWQESTGTNLEFKYTQEFNIAIEMLGPDWHLF